MGTVRFKEFNFDNVDIIYKDKKVKDTIAYVKQAVKNKKLYLENIFKEEDEIRLNLGKLCYLIGTTYVHKISGVSMNTLHKYRRMFYDYAIKNGYKVVQQSKNKKAKLVKEGEE